MRNALPSNGVLALDLATSVGYAYGPPSDKLPHFGTWKLPKAGGEGARYAAFVNELCDFLDETDPATIIIEAALPPQAQTNVTSCRTQYGLRAFVHEAAYRKSILNILEIDAMTVRLEVHGRCNYPEKGRIKIEVLRHCRNLGIDVSSHDAADACMVWLWYRQRVLNLPPVAGPLFRERVA